MRFRGKGGRPGRPKNVMTYEEMLKDLKRAIEREAKVRRRNRRKG